MYANTVTPRDLERNAKTRKSAHIASQGIKQRQARLGLRNLVMATLDQEAFDLCQKYHYGEQCVPGSISVLNKYTLLLIGLQLGLYCIELKLVVYSSLLYYIKYITLCDVILC